MPATTLPTLIGGPYRTPRVKPGQSLACLMRGEVEIDGITEGRRSTTEGLPLAWPYREGIAGKRSLLLAADLVKAVRTESVQAVALIWGVHRRTVLDWRKALGVGRFNPGTRRLWRDLAATRLSPEARRKGGRAGVVAMRAAIKAKGKRG